MEQFRRRLAFLICAVSLGLAGMPARAAVGDWVVGDNVRMRLVASGLNLDGKLDAAIELELADGWHTYWINPGEAGIPPLVDVSASENIGMASVRYPVPHLWTDGSVTSNVYEGRIVLPMQLPVMDPGKPVRLAVKLDLGVCDEVCIPVTLTDTLEVKPGMTDLTAVRIVGAAVDELPGKPRPGTFAVDALTGVETRPGLYRLAARVSVPEPGDAELFVAGPEGWFVGRPERVADGQGLAFNVPVEPHQGADIAAADFVLVLVSGGKAVTQTMRLDD